MMASFVAVILLCFGAQCKVVDGSPHYFGNEADCFEYLDEVAQSLIEQEGATVMMMCSDNIYSLDGTLPVGN